MFRVAIAQEKLVRIVNNFIIHVLSRKTSVVVPPPPGSPRTNAYATSPKTLGVGPPPGLQPRPAPYAPTRAVVAYNGGANITSQSYGNAASQQPQPQLIQPQAATTTTSHAAIVAYADSFRRFVFGGTARFFGVDAETDDSARIIWIERRKRLAIKLFGGIKDSEFPVENNHHQHHHYQYGGSVGQHQQQQMFDRHLTSELEGDKMVLKITRPPRNKDSISSLAGQGVSWMLNSLMTRKPPSHAIVSEREVSRSYQPSTTGIAAYYAAEQTGGLAVCPPPLPRVPSSHHLHGESPAEEVRTFVRPVVCLLKPTSPFLCEKGVKRRLKGKKEYKKLFGRSV